MFTDIHTHVFHPRIAANALASLDKRGFPPVGAGVIDDLLLRAKTAGIERVVCLTAALAGGQVWAANNFVLALQQRQKTAPADVGIVPFGTVHPDYPRWEAELDRLEAAGVKGLKVHPHFQNLPFDDPRLLPILETVKNRFIVLCHVSCEKPLETNPSNPYKLAKLVARFPQTIFVAAHLGGYGDFRLAADALAGKSVRLDTSNTLHMGEEGCRAILAKHPFDKLLFGTDYPLYDPVTDIALQQKRFGLSDGKMADLMSHADALLQ
ncbi:amidohydrolase [Deltaproteobacteria bacterium]|nr:amidohydrolase [Deltaproteobacteria bacterium]